MTADWFTTDNVSIIAEAIFWLSVIVLSPVIYKVVYFLTAPLWAWLFPAKLVELQYTIDGKTYTATVNAQSNLSEASSNLMAVATKKHMEDYG